MSVDNTHTKYLRGTDKKVWENYKSAYESQQKLENLMESFKVPKDLKAGEVYDIPMRKNKEK